MKHRMPTEKLLAHGRLSGCAGILFGSSELLGVHLCSVDSIRPQSRVSKIHGDASDTCAAHMPKYPLRISKTIENLRHIKGYIGKHQVGIVGDGGNRNGKAHDS